MTTNQRTYTEQTIPLDRIVADPTVQIRKALREDAVTRYMDSFGFLPPVDVFDVDGILLLADGFHRFSAATRLAAKGELVPAELRAKVYLGTREEALEFAVLANAATGEKLTPEERDDGIRRLQQLHPSRSEAVIGQMMGVSHFVVHKVKVVDRVRRRVLWKPAIRISDSIVYEVGLAPEVHWEALLKAADRRTWTIADVRRARELLADDDVPSDYKQALLAGNAQPLPPGTKVPPTVFAMAVEGPAGEDDSGDEEEEVERWRDPVGTDVAERHRPVRWGFWVEYQQETDETRQRGVRQYKREAEHVRQQAEGTVNRLALDGLGDPRNPGNDRGLAYLLQEANRVIWRAWSGEWPDAAPQAGVAR